MKASATFFCAVSILVTTAVSAQVDILTQHYNNQRTGWNNQEQVLNTTNVKPGSFGKLFSCAVDDQVYGQPLIVSGVTIPGAGIRNILYVATVNNTVYAFDADANRAEGPYWSRNLTLSGTRPPMNTDMTGACGGNYQDFSGNMGIVGTPVIDKTTNTIYLVSRTISTDASKTYTQYLHAIDITTGTEKPNSPTVITAQVTGTGGGSSGGKIAFNPQKQNQRPGLLLLNGVVYIGYSSHCDWNPYHGWLLGYDATTLQQKYVYCSTPYGSEGGIWMAGSGPSADEAGNIFVATGNGSTGVGTDVTDPRNRATTLLKLSPSLTQLDYFTPTNYATLNSGDLDFGCSEVLVIPGLNRVFVGAKDGSLYLTDVNNLGGYSSAGNNIVQQYNLPSQAHLRSSFGYYKGTANEYIYTWSENTALRAIPVNRAAGNLDAGHVVQSGLQGPTGNNGANITTSSNGSDDNTAILWAAHSNNCDANHQVCPGIVRAVSAADVTTELWNSTIVPLDNLGNYAKFSSPAVANGKLYVSTFSNQIVVYGLQKSSGGDGCVSPNLALNKPAMASSVQTTAYPASYAFDGTQSTRWSSAYSDAQWICVDLGQRYDVCRVTIFWETAYGKDFDIQVSDDALNWTTVNSVRGNTSKQSVLPLQGSGRYVRMNGITRGTQYGYSILEMEVYGEPSVTCLPPTGAQAGNIQQNTATLTWNPVAGATGYSVRYKAVTDADWITTTSTANSIGLAALSCATDYLFQIATNCSNGQTSTYTASAGFSTAACPAGCGPIPTRWTTSDIGSVGKAGEACFDGSTFTMQGSGGDIGGTTDQFRFAYVTLTGDDQFVGQVLSQDAADPADKMGIMIRQNLGSDAPNAFISLTHDQGALFQYRSVAGGITTGVAAPGIAAPYWVRMVKSGSTYSGLVSPDGLTWSPVGAAMDLGFGAGGSTTYAGLAITSHNNSTLSTASLDNFSQATPLPIGLTGFSAHMSGKTIVLEWTTAFEQNSDHFDLERSSDGIHFIPIITVPATGTSDFSEQYKAVDAQPGRGVNYYRLKEVDRDDRATYSPIILVRFTDEAAPALFPNPVGNYFRLVAGTSAIQQVNVFDLLGRKMLSLGNTAAGSTLFVACGRLAPGVYIVESRTSQGRYLQKMLKQ